eukprot:7949404-Ditylum_brightwellii.AAC.1
MLLHPKPRPYTTLTSSKLGRQISAVEGCWSAFNLAKSGESWQRNSYRFLPVPFALSALAGLTVVLPFSLVLGGLGPHHPPCFLGPLWFCLLVLTPEEGQ